MQPSFRFQPTVHTLEARAVPAAFPMTDDRVVLTPDDGGLPKIKVINPANGEDVGEIQVYDNAFRGGVLGELKTSFIYTKLQVAKSDPDQDPL
ncbi:MAG: hypothetical protein ABGY75_14550 [Gemmataceae bacterium]